MPPKKRSVSEEASLPEEKRVAIDLDRFQEYYEVQKDEGVRMQTLKKFVSETGFSDDEMICMIQGVNQFKTENGHLALCFLDTCRAFYNLSNTVRVYQDTEERMRVLFEYAELNKPKRAELYLSDEGWEKRGTVMYATDLIGPPRWFTSYENGCAACDGKEIMYRLKSTFVFLCAECFGKRMKRKRFKFQFLQKMPPLAVVNTPNHQDVMTLPQ